ncbi:MAG: NAD(P)H-dependent oxidoreductase [Pseudomonadota bacterium]
MKCAVVLAHPKSTSFCSAIARRCVDTLTASGHSVVLRDLYAMDFDPRLKAEELPTPTGCRAAPDVARERELLAEADLFVFVYPFWFNAPPAILKGYVDRVFSLRFGYAADSGGTAPLLVGRRLMSFSTSGAPDQWVNATGALKALMQVFDLHLAAVSGLEVAGHLHLGGIHSLLAEDSAADMLDQVTASLAAAAPATSRPT